MIFPILYSVVYIALTAATFICYNENSDVSLTLFLIKIAAMIVLGVVCCKTASGLIKKEKYKSCLFSDVLMKCTILLWAFFEVPLLLFVEIGFTIMSVIVILGPFLFAPLFTGLDILYCMIICIPAAYYGIQRIGILKKSDIISDSVAAMLKATQRLPLLNCASSACIIAIEQKYKAAKIPTTTVKSIVPLFILITLILGGLFVAACIAIPFTLNLF